MYQLFQKYIYRSILLLYKIAIRNCFPYGFYISWIVIIKVGMKGERDIAMIKTIRVSCVQMHWAKSLKVQP